MALHKKIFYFIISTLLIPSFIYARNEHYQEIERKAHAWATPLKDQLSDEEKTIIANILYISWEYSALDSQVRSIVSNLHNNAALLNQQIQNNIDATQLLKSIAAQINLLNQDLLPSRDIVLPIWEQAHIYNDEKTSLNVSAAFEALFPINEEIVLEFLTSYSQNIDDILTNANHILLKNNKHLTVATNSFVELLTNPNFINKANPDILDKVMVAFNAADVANNAITASIAQIEQVKEIGFVVQRATTVVLGMFYDQFIQVMELKEQPLAAFDKNGIIKPEERTLKLPFAIFETQNAE
jgi:hypothetical protein